jgi:hypothetical protein
METMTRKAGRPPKALDECVRRGVFCAMRFPRGLYRQVRAAARRDGIAISTWIRLQVADAVAARQRGT